jgi:tripartite-type tricarboxylate transporter receptor subunit TctC
VLTRRDVVRSAALASLALPFVTTARAEGDEYPSGPIHSICPFAPGSGADTKIRFYSNKLQALAGKPVIVENKPGAMGNIATEAVARAKPDGYTIYISPASSLLASAPSLFKELAYDPIKDFEPITTLNSSAFVLCVAGSSPYKNVADLTADLKKKGSNASYGSIAPPSLVAAEIYKNEFGLKTVEVKYRDQNGLLNDLYGGNIAFFFGDLTAAVAQIKEGKLRALSTSSAKPLKSAPDIPGAAQAGIPNMDVVTWWAVHVPAHTPKPVCAKLETWFNEIAIAPDVVAFVESVGSDPMPGNAQMLRDLMTKQIALWHEYARIARIEPL